MLKKIIFYYVIFKVHAAGHSTGWESTVAGACRVDRLACSCAWAQQRPVLPKPYKYTPSPAIYHFKQASIHNTPHTKMPRHTDKKQEVIVPASAQQPKQLKDIAARAALELCTADLVTPYCSVSGNVIAEVVKEKMGGQVPGALLDLIMAQIPRDEDWGLLQMVRCKTCRRLLDRCNAVAWEIRQVDGGATQRIRILFSPRGEETWRPSKRYTFKCYPCAGLTPQSQQ